MEKFSFKKRIQSFGYAWTGMKGLISKEHNAWIHSVAAVTVVVMGSIFDISRLEWALVIICIGMVLAAEGFNTALERLVDLVSPERNPKAGEVKDIAAGAVLFTAIAAAFVGVLVFLPHILQMLGR